MLEIKRKNTKGYYVNITDMGLPMNLSGYSAKISLFSKDKSRVIWVKSIDPITDPESSKIYFKLSKAEADQIEGDYLLDIEIESETEFFTPLNDEKVKFI